MLTTKGYKLKVELKSVKFFERMSEETNAFVANIYIDGKKSGEAKNEGQGGCTHYYFSDPKVRDAFETYAKSLPAIVIEGSKLGQKEDYTMEMNGEHLIDELFTEWLKASYEKKDAQKFERAAKKAKAEYAAKGWLCVQIHFDGGMGWIPVKPNSNEATIKESVERYMAKSKKAATSWKLI